MPSLNFSGKDKFTSPPAESQKAPDDLQPAIDLSTKLATPQIEKYLASGPGELALFCEGHPKAAQLYFMEHPDRVHEFLSAVEWFLDHGELGAASTLIRSAFPPDSSLEPPLERIGPKLQDAYNMARVANVRVLHEALEGRVSQPYRDWLSLTVFDRLKKTLESANVIDTDWLGVFNLRNREPTFRAAAAVGVVHGLRFGFVDRARNLKVMFGLQDSELQSLFEQRLGQAFDANRLRPEELLKWVHHAVQAIGASPTITMKCLVIGIVKQVIRLPDGNIGVSNLQPLSDVIGSYGISPGHFKASKVQYAAAHFGLRVYFASDKTSHFEHVCNLFDPDDDILDDASRSYLRNAIEAHDTGPVVKLAAILPPEKIVALDDESEIANTIAIARTLFANANISEGRYLLAATGLLEDKSIFEDLRPEIDDLLQRLLRCRCDGCVKQAADLAEIGAIPQLSLNELKVHSLRSALNEGRVDAALSYLSRLGINIDEIEGGELAKLAADKALKFIQEGPPECFQKLINGIPTLASRLAGPAFREKTVKTVLEMLSHHMSKDAGLLQRTTGISDPRIDGMAQKCAEIYIGASEYGMLANLVGEFSVVGPTFAGRVRKSLFESMERGSWPGELSLRQLKWSFQVPEQQFRTPRAQACGLQLLCVALDAGNIEQAVEVQRQFQIPAECVPKRSIMTALADSDGPEWSDAHSELLRAFPLTQSDLSEPGDAELVHFAFRNAVRGNDVMGARLLKESFQFSPEQMSLVTNVDLPHVINNHRAIGGAAMADAIGIPLEYPTEQILVQLSPYYKQLVQSFGLASLGEFFTFVPSNQEYCNWLVRHESASHLTPESYAVLRNPKADSRKGLPLTLIEAEWLAKAGLDLVQAAHRRDYERIYLLLNRQDASERGHFDLQRIAVRWGYECVLEYLYRPTGVPVGNRRQCIEALELLHRQSGLPIEILSKTIVAQISRDGASYEQHSPPDELAVILRNCHFNMSRLEEIAKSFPELEPLQALLQEFRSDKNKPFESWTALKRYYRLESALNNNSFLSELMEARRSDPDLYQYVCTLYFQTSSRVNADALRDLLLHPERFLARADRHIPRPLQDVLKPSNLTGGRVTRLDMSAHDLRAAWVSGTLNELQALHPMKITYRIPKSGRYFSSPAQALSAALGTQSSGVTGIARIPRKLFAEAKAGFTKRGLDLKAYLNGELTEIGVEAEQWVLNLVYNQTIGISEQWVTFQASLHAKNDPEAATVGDDTACCMPFGEAKTNIYGADPNISLFTVQMIRGDGATRTVAQSVVTRDIDIQQSFAPVVQAMKESNSTDIAKILRSPPRMNAEFFLSCDNLQMAPNAAASANLCEVSRRIYADFYTQYMERFGESDALHRDYLLVGEGSSSGIEPLEAVASTFMPLTSPIGYCDRNGAQVRRIPLGKAAKLLFSSVELSQEGARTGQLTNVRTSPGVSLVNLTDTVAYAYLQGTAYPTQEDLIPGIQYVRNALTGSAINNKLKRRPTLSVKECDEAGVMRAALCAYQGVHEGRPAVYLDEVISNAPNQLAAFHLLNAFTDRYLQAYGAREAFPQIVVEVYGLTGERLANQAMRRFGNRYRLNFDVNKVLDRRPERPLREIWTIQVTPRQ